MPEAVQGAGKRPSLSCPFCCVPLGAESPAHRCIWQGERWRRGLREHGTQDLQPRPPWPSLLLFTGSFTLFLSIFRTAPRPTLCFHQVQRLFPVLILNSETPGATPGLLHPTPGPERVWGRRAAIGDPGVLGADPAPTAAGSWKHRALYGKRAENVP